MSQKNLKKLARQLKSLRFSPEYACYATSLHNSIVDAKLLDHGIHLLDVVTSNAKVMMANLDRLVEFSIEQIRSWTNRDTPMDAETLARALRRAGLRSGAYTDLIIQTINVCIILNLFEILLGLRSSVSSIKHPSARPLIDLLLSLDTIKLDKLLDFVPIEGSLRADPALVYCLMDEVSQKNYRILIYKYATSWSVQEEVIAEACLELARRAHERKAPVSRCHVGYYLAGPGRSDLLNETCGPRRRKFKAGRLPELPSQLSRLQSWAALALFLVVFVLFRQCSVAPVPAVLLSVVLLDTLAVLLEQCLARHIEERHLPSLEFVRNGIPSSATTALATPCLLSSTEHLNATVELLEKNFLTANDTCVNAVLLTDFPDSSHEEPTAEQLETLAAARRKIEDLNGKYAAWADEPFILLHRGREYSVTEKKWIGFERKRGKLNSLNDFILRGKDAFSCKVGGVTRLRDVKYVLVLDEDCELCAGCVQLLVGTLAHPLVSPTINQELGRLEEGHVILVPYMATNGERLKNWACSNLVTGRQETRRSPHASMRNALFDHFGATHYPGKGLYHVEAFDYLCRHKIPNGRILSHDTIEAIWTRPGYVGRARLLEGFPANIDSLYLRRHRWVRGDIQNAAYTTCELLRRPEHVYVPPVVRAVLVTQLKSSITPIIVSAIGVIIVFGAQDKGGAFLMIALLLTLGFPPLWNIGTSMALNHLSKGERVQLIVRGLLDSIKLAFYRVGSALHQSILTIDAYIKTIYRLIIRRRLLDWTAASDCDKISSTKVTLITWYAYMSSLMASILLIFVYSRSKTTVQGVAIVIMWILFPLMRRAFFSPRVARRV
jgi:cyclic beta-1,2-glucan synthetase